jgi:phage tail-like protein
MDVNNTRLWALMGEQDWAPWFELNPAFQWDQTGAGLSLAPRVPLRPSAEHGGAGALPRGAAADQRGNRYWITPEGEIWWAQRGGQPPGRFWSRSQPFPDAASKTFLPTPDAGRAPVLTGLAVTDRQYLVAGCSGPAGLLVFDLAAGGPPSWRRWKGRFAPVDLRPAPDGGLWILDRAGGGRLWHLDAGLVPHPRGITELAAGDEPVALAGLPDGSVLVLDAGSDAVPASASLYRQGNDRVTWRLQLARDQTLPSVPGGLSLRPRDCIFVPDVHATGQDAAGTVYLTAAGYEQAFAFTVQTGANPAWSLLPASVPLTGMPELRLVADAGVAYYAAGPAWRPLVAEDGAHFAHEGSLVIGPLNSGREHCVWHRLILDACLPAHTEIMVESRAHNDLDMLAAGELPWSPEPLLYRRAAGSEIPYFQPFSAAELQQPGTGTWELLFQQARGRYLEIRLRFRTNGLHAPAIRNARIWYERFSYLAEYLPAVYREQPVSASFLERFLANPEGIFTALEARIAAAQVLFDPRVTPPEYLDWLASWYGVTLDPTWDDRRRRLFLAHAPELFALRGTLRGMILTLRLATDPDPGDDMFTADLSAYMGRLPPPGEQTQPGYTFRILEDWAWRQPARADSPRPDPASSAHRFRVQVPIFADADQGPDPAVVFRVVAREKPAHTEFRIEPYWAMFRVGEAQLGLDTRLASREQAAGFALGLSNLGLRQLAPPGDWRMRPPVADATRVGGAMIQGDDADEIWREEGTES